MAEYIDKSADVGNSYLTDWYINSVAEYDEEKLNEPRWTEAHIKELTNDFIIIPKDTPAADVAPVVHGHWTQADDTKCRCRKCRCSNCGVIALVGLYPHGDKNYCPSCGAKMDEEEHNNV